MEQKSVNTQTEDDDISQACFLEYEWLCFLGADLSHQSHMQAWNHLCVLHLVCVYWDYPLKKGGHELWNTE